VTEKIYQISVPADKRLSITLMRILLSSAQTTLPFSSKNIKISEMFEEKDSEELENIVLELFNPTFKDIGNYNGGFIHYIPDHPILSKFRKLLSQVLSEYSQRENIEIDIPEFLTEFNYNLVKNLENEKHSNSELESLLNKWKINQDFYNLLRYIENAKNLFLEPNKIDKKSLSDYFLENKIYKVDTHTWHYDELNIYNKEEIDLDTILKSKKSVEVIDAPYGIGKSTFAKYIGYRFAKQFIENPVDKDVHIPILVPLKFGLERTCNDRSLINDLNYIKEYKQENRYSKILVI
jgi:hypothetical protein